LRPDSLTKPTEIVTIIVFHKLLAQAMAARGLVLATGTTANDDTPVLSFPVKAVCVSHESRVEQSMYDARVVPIGLHYTFAKRLIDAYVNVTVQAALDNEGVEIKLADKLKLVAAIKPPSEPTKRHQPCFMSRPARPGRRLFVTKGKNATCKFKIKTGVNLDRLAAKSYSDQRQRDFVTKSMLQSELLLTSIDSQARRDRAVEMYNEIEAAQLRTEARVPSNHNRMPIHLYLPHGVLMTP
jgi:hypothetical protein